MRHLFSGTLLFCFLFLSCSNSQDALEFKTQYGSPKALLAHLEKDQVNWWTYHKKEIILSSEFKALDTDDRSITKKVFLDKLKSGVYMALKVLDQNERTYYKLFSIRETAHAAISPMIKIDAQNAFIHHLKEGKVLSDFSFIDINGKTYSSESIKGKKVILKTWFIGCAPCIAEMPDLNELVSAYEGRKDVLFISLALDKKEALQKFLIKTQFDYSVVAEQKDFINDELGEYAYPTHFIIDEDGIIRKVVNNFEELKMAMKSLGV